jgi:hypothetical protein
MAWSVGNFFVAPGATVTIRFHWGSGDDHGPQWVMAHPFPGEPEAWLATERVAKKLICEVGEVIQNGPSVFRCAETGSRYEYQVWITNDGSEGCHFAIQGGGV